MLSAYAAANKHGRGFILKRQASPGIPGGEVKEITPSLWEGGRFLMFQMERKEDPDTHISTATARQRLIIPPTSVVYCAATGF